MNLRHWHPHVTPELIFWAWLALALALVGLGAVAFAWLSIWGAPLQ